MCRPTEPKHTRDLREKRDERDALKTGLRLRLGRLTVGVRTLQPSLDWEDGADGRSLDAPDIAPLFRHRNQ